MLFLKDTVNKNASIQVEREPGFIKLSIDMPIWTNKQDDGSIIVRMPLFGLSTVAFSDDDITPAIEEALHVFCKASEKFGRGFESELKALGWEIDNGDRHNSSMDFNVDNDRDPVFGEMMQTGEPFVDVLELECA